MYRSAPVHNVFRPSATPLRVRFADVDMMRVVHHSAYVHWCEQIRFAFLENILGVTIADIEKAAIAFPVMECKLKYHRAVVFGEPVVGFGQIEVFRNSQFAVHYQIWSERGSGHLAAHGSTLHCFVNTGLHLLLKPPALMREAFERGALLYPEGIRFETASIPQMVEY